MSRESGGWWDLAEWGLAFGLLAFSVITGFSIGFLILPFAIAALVLALRRTRAWPEAPTGGLVGIGAVLLMIAFLHRNDVLCRPEDQTMVLRRGESFSCGGLNPVPWLAAGAAASAFGLGGYLAWRRNHRTPASTV